MKVYEHVDFGAQGSSDQRVEGKLAGKLIELNVFEMVLSIDILL